MARVKRGVLNNRKHKKFLKLAKGIYGRANRCYKIGRRMGERAMQFRYIGLKCKKREMRSKFISVINAFCRINEVKYSRFINLFNKSKYANKLDRKSMAIAIQNSQIEFSKIFKKIMGIADTELNQN